MLPLTIVVQVFRVLGIWLVGDAVGVDVSPRPYFVIGPLLFLVMLVPFTVNGLAVREAFFVSFLGKLHVTADQAFSTGFLFFGLSVVLAHPGRTDLGSSAARLRRTRARTSAPADPKEKPHDRGQDRSAVVIPAYNEEKLLPRRWRASRASSTASTSSTTPRATGRSASLTPSPRAIRASW